MKTMAAVAAFGMLLAVVACASGDGYCSNCVGLAENQESCLEDCG